MAAAWRWGTFTAGSVAAVSLSVHARQPMGGIQGYFKSTRSTAEKVSLLRNSPTHNPVQIVAGTETAKAIWMKVQMKVRRMLLETGGKVTLFKSQGLHRMGNVLVILGRACRQ